MAHRGQYAVPAPVPAPVVHAPQHPVPQLQGPFEESMLESGNDENEVDVFADPVARRNALLDAPVYTRIIAGRWRKKPDECFHPLWKLIAQISFGIHLLAEGMAKSEDEVMQILQAHVDEIDGFLERTTEDFDLAQGDISERLRCLKLPLSHPATFDKMLEDRNFRLSIVEGNEKIEHIVERTTHAMRDSLKDVQKGFESTSCLEIYLHDLSSRWHRETMEHEAVFVAMLGNVEGWRKAFMSLHMQGNKLGGSLKKLTDIINEMQARAGEVSRRLLHQARVQYPQSMGRPTDRVASGSRYQPGVIGQKQLPTMPSMPQRPPLRQTVSSNTMRTASRTPSSDALREQALLVRSQTPQHDMPATQKLRSEAVPKVVSIGANAQARVQSMVPSLLEAAPSPALSKTNQPEPITEDEAQLDRYFPPVELPAHVPEETLRAAPMSKQNRLSSGLGLVQANRAEKRNSKLLGPSALIDLLRPANRKQSVSTTKSKSPQTSRRASTVRSGGTGIDDGGVNTKKKLSIQSPARSLSSDTTSQHTKTNVRRPKKGVQHWFDALDDESSDADTTPTATAAPTIPAEIPAPPAPPAPLKDPETPAQPTKPIGPTNSVNDTPPLPPKKNAIVDTTPGTPSWAVNTFAKAERHKELLKKGAFNSHPPGVPLGSPPMMQDTLTPAITAAVNDNKRRMSHNSSTGLSTLGEPGPEVTASETGSMTASVPGPESTDVVTDSAPAARIRFDYNKRQSAFAPEVVMVDKFSIPKSSKNFFIAEMEGSIPVSIPASESSRTFPMELEAPQQYFKLPPRPHSEVPIIHEAPDAQVHLPHFQLPPRPVSASNHSEANKSSTVDVLSSVPSIVTGPPEDQSDSVAGSDSKATSEHVPDQDAHLTLPKDATIVEEHENTKESPKVQPPSLITTAASPYPEGLKSITITPSKPADGEIVERVVESAPTGELLSSKVYVATPCIPLPPSPGAQAVMESTPPSTATAPAVQASLYILPAIAYKAPPLSPGLPPSPKWSPPAHQSQDETEPGPVAEEQLPSTSFAVTRQPEAHKETSPAPVQKSPESVAKSTPQEEYDPFRAQDDEPTGPVRVSPVMTKTKVAILEVPKPIDVAQRTVQLEGRQNRGSSDAQNDWKAFFTGKASPAGSNLSIRSIKRESMLENQAPGRVAGPTSPKSAGRDKTLPPRPPSSSSMDKSTDDSRQKATTNLVQGLGITLEAREEGS